ncbi:hypothetical protein ES703_45760 [subsurface metagenome]
MVRVFSDTPPMTPEQIRDSLLSLPDNDRMFIITDPEPGEHKIIALRRNSGRIVEYDYEGVPE